MSELLEVLKNYEFYSTVETIEKMSGGNINESYKVITADGGKYVLQKINAAVFPDPRAVMDNIIAVTGALNRAKFEKSLDKMEVLNIIFTLDGDSLAERGGSFYRVYSYMNGAVSYSSPAELHTISEAGRAFGGFASLMSCGPRIKLKETLADLHNTPLKFQKLTESYAACRGDRRREAEDTYRYLAEKREFIDRISRLVANLPARIVHGDTKCDNVMFDRSTGEALGVIDLDTVMYGAILYDFGDGARSICCSSREDETDLRKIKFDLSRFEAFADGYIGEVKHILTDGEKRLMPYGAQLAALELAARFLTDYLDGDVYFRIGYTGHNLDRARCQAALAVDIEDKLPQIKKILCDICD